MHEVPKEYVCLYLHTDSMLCLNDGLLPVFKITSNPTAVATRASELLVRAVKLQLAEAYQNCGVNADCRRQVLGAAFACALRQVSCARWQLPVAIFVTQQDENKDLSVCPRLPVLPPCSVDHMPLLVMDLILKGPSGLDSKCSSPSTPPLCTSTAVRVTYTTSLIF